MDQRTCMICLKPIKRFKGHFCSPECFEEWLEREKEHWHPGYSLIAGNDGEINAHEPRK